jgi:hypothetical protein
MSRRKIIQVLLLANTTLLRVYVPCIIIYSFLCCYERLSSSPRYCCWIYTSVMSCNVSQTCRLSFTCNVSCTCLVSCNVPSLIIILVCAIHLSTYSQPRLTTMAPKLLSIKPYCTSNPVTNRIMRLTATPETRHYTGCEKSNVTSYAKTNCQCDTVELEHLLYRLEFYCVIHN